MPPLRSRPGSPTKDAASTTSIPPIAWPWRRWPASPKLQVAEFTGEPWETPLRVEPLNRAQWARRFLDDERGLLEGLAGSLEQRPGSPAPRLGRRRPRPGVRGRRRRASVPSGPAMVRQLMQMMGPMMLGMMAGSTAGHLAARALGHYELPLPRALDRPLAMVLANVDAFAEEWTLPVDDIRVWVVPLRRGSPPRAGHPPRPDPHRAAGRRLHRSFSSDPEEIERQARDLGLDELIGDHGTDLAGPAADLAQAIPTCCSVPCACRTNVSSCRSSRRWWRWSRVGSTTSSTTSARLLRSEYHRVTEALRRRRVQAGRRPASSSSCWASRCRRRPSIAAARFVDGWCCAPTGTRWTMSWSSPGNLPTASEIDAPGLWMARVGIEGERAAAGGAT